MTQDPFIKFKPVDDFVLIETIKIESKETQKMEKLDLVGMDAPKPKNPMATPMAKLEQVKKELLEEWDEHPFQGIVKAVGEGRYLEDDIKIPMNVKVGDRIAIIEAMKMNNNIDSTCDGEITQIPFKTGSNLAKGDIICTIKAFE